MEEILIRDPFFPMDVRPYRCAVPIKYMTKTEQIVALFAEVNKLQADVIGVDTVSDARADLLIKLLTSVRDELNQIDQEADDQ